MSGSMRIKSLLHISLAAALLVSCESIDETLWLQRSATPYFVGNVEYETVKTETSSSTIRFTATVKLSGSKQDLNVHHFLVSKNKDMTDCETVGGTTMNSSSTVSVTATKSVANDATYYVQAEIGRSVGEESIRSSIISFTLGAKEAPAVSNITISDIGYMGAQIKASDVFDRGYPISNMGILFSCNAADLNIETLPVGNESNYSIPLDNTVDFRCNVSSAARKAGLDKTDAPLYYVRVYASNLFGTGYSDIKSFSTIRWPGLKSSTISSTYNSVKYIFDLERDPADKLSLTKYVCYYIKNVYSSSKSIEGDTVSGLTPDTEYYLWAQIENEYHEIIHWDAQNIRTQKQ